MRSKVAVSGSNERNHHSFTLKIQAKRDRPYSSERAERLVGAASRREERKTQALPNTSEEISGDRPPSVLFLEERMGAMPTAGRAIAQTPV
jgi:hypothetical protein